MYANSIGDAGTTFHYEWDKKNAELNEVVDAMDRDEAHTECGITKLIDMLDYYLTSNPFLKLAQTYRQWKS